jgi:hypothetical protein
MLKTLDSASNFIRAVVSLVVTGIVGAAGWLGYETYYAKDLVLKEKDAQLAASQAQIDAMNKDLEVKQREIERLDTAMWLLKVDHRIAQLEVLDQKKDPASGRLVTRFSFVETDDQGRPLEQPREFEIEGNEVYVDAWVVSFNDEFVEQGDPLRGTALCLFRRIFGQYQSPAEGFELDAVGARPAAYSHGSEPSELEKKIFGDFWEYANNPERKKEDGVRNVQGKASYTQLRPHMKYRLMLRSTGDLTIDPDTSAARKAL